MTFEALARLHKAHPFAPSRLELGDGQKVQITHPERMAYNPKGARMIYVAPPDGGFKMIDLLLVVSAESTNGRSYRQRRR